MTPANLELSGLPFGKAIECLRVGGLNYLSYKGVPRWVTDGRGKKVGAIVHLRRGWVFRLDAINTPTQSMLSVLAAWNVAIGWNTSL